MANNSSENNLQAITEIESIPCKVSPYSPFNTTRGLMYIKHIDFSVENTLPEFETWLSENYNTNSIALAPFIKPRDPSTVAVIATFNDNHLPYTIYIPGEESDTKIYPFNNKPMMCHKCQNYGHTAARCRSETLICRRCAAPGHKAEDCDQETRSKCYHCQENHAAGSRVCSRNHREQIIRNIQSEQKVSQRRAIQIEKDEHILPTTQTEVLHDIIEITMTENDKKTFTPWLLEKCLTGIMGNVKNA